MDFLGSFVLLEEESMGLYRAAKSIGFPVLKRVVRFYYHDLRIAAAILRRALSVTPSVVAVHEGEALHPSQVYAIFLLWQPRGFSWSIENALTSLNAVGANVVAVVNHGVTDEGLNYLKQRCRFILIRDNTGFDFGGYRDATLYLHRRRIEPDRVIYLNDSIYYFKSNLNELFFHLSKSEADISAPFENGEFSYHVQSFCYSVSGRLFCHSAHRMFWEAYLPVNSRLWAIQKGEIGFSRAIVPIAQSVEILYHPDKLKRLIDRLPMNELARLNKYFPVAIRLSPSQLRNARKAALVNQIVSNVALRSQIHTGAFLYRRFMGCPLMKRDLVYRLQFSLDEVEELLIETGHEGHLQSILGDFREKGSGNNLSFLKKARLAVGVL